MNLFFQSKILNQVFLCLLPLFMVFNASAQSWPDKPIRVIVPFPPGGGTDTFVRPLAIELSKQFGQQVFVETRSGAGGTIGAAVAAKSAADGYTILAGAVHHTVNESVYKNLTYSLSKDLIPVISIASVPDVLLVSTKLPVSSVQELIAYSKKNPGKVNFGSSGNGTTRHINGEIFNKLTGTSLVHIPYKGSGPSLVALVGGEIDVMIVDIASVSSFIKSGQVRALAVTAPNRVAEFPDIPTMAQAGVPNFESISWYGLWVPTGTSQIIQDKISADVIKSLNTPALKTIWAANGATTGPSSQKEFIKYVNDETAKWGKVVKSFDISIN